MTARRILLKVHLWFGLAAAIVLAILGLTGSILAFQNDIDHWLHPELFYIKRRQARLARTGVDPRGGAEVRSGARRCGTSAPCWAAFGAVSPPTGSSVRFIRFISGWCPTPQGATRRRDR